MQPIYERRVTIEVKLCDSVGETQRVIEAALSQQGKWSSWAVIDALTSLFRRMLWRGLNRMKCPLVLDVLTPGSSKETCNTAKHSN
jgi:hypothetical protein